jgi:basic amino acid/polyamine antiporter, APA family
VHTQRDAGLIRAVGPWTLAAGAVSMIVGGGIFAAPAALAAGVGSYAAWVFLGCGVAVGAVAICFAEGGSRVPTSGGIYGLVEAAFGPLVAFVAGTLLWVGCVLACGAIAAALADVVASAVPQHWTATVRAAVIIGVIAAVALVNIGGVARGARLVAFMTAAKLIPLLVFVAVGAGAMHVANFAQVAHPDGQALRSALVIGVFSFIGMETPLCASGEVRDPSRTIPRALALAMLFVIALYVAIQIVAQGILGPSLAASKAPLADAMARIHPALRALLLAGAAVSMSGYVASDIFGTPRQLFAFARDGLLPGALGRLHARSHAPHVAILCYAIIAAALALSGSFARLAVWSTLAIAALYAAGCVAAWLLARRGIALAGPPLRFRQLTAAMIVGTGSMLAVIALGSSQEIAGLVALIVLSIVIYLLQGRSRVVEVQ